MAKQEALSFMEFKSKFNSEDACREHLFKMRWPDGFRCPKCGNDTYYVISTRNCYECTSCHYQASVTVGTVINGTLMNFATGLTVGFLRANYSIELLIAASPHKKSSILN